MKKYLNSVEEVVKSLKERNKLFESFKSGDTERIKEITLIDGIICTKDDIGYGIHLLSACKYYTEEPEPLKFEVNALYKTSKNKKAFLYKIINGANFPNYFSSEDGCFTTDINGVFYNFGVPTNDKIVGYWEGE